jgi:SAM-dependent methyltransferase
MSTAYDDVKYPTQVWKQTCPSRVSALAKLAGLPPLPSENPRILEVGGGNCCNSMSIATIYPNAEVHGFDLSTEAIAAGQDMLRLAGLNNVTLVVEDICRAHERYPARSFDFVIVHGVYAWVPGPVREAILALFNHVLTDHGIAFVSYNLMPGGFLRQALRDVLLYNCRDETDPQRRLMIAHGILERIAHEDVSRSDFGELMQSAAKKMLTRPPEVVFHDEMGEAFAPQRFVDVVAAAGNHGLRFLTDINPYLELDGFLDLPADQPTSGDQDTRIIEDCNMADYMRGRYFRQNLFVRTENAFDRRLVPERLCDLYVATKMRRTEGNWFEHGEAKFEIGLDDIADGLERAAAIYPERMLMSEITTDPDKLRGMLQLFERQFIFLHTEPANFVRNVGNRPMSSAFARMCCATDQTMVFSLNHTGLRIDGDPLRKLLLAADGSRTVAELAQVDTGILPEKLDEALETLAGQGLFWR